MPEVLAEHHLPKMLDASGILSNNQLGNVFNGADNRSRVPFQRRFAPAIQSGLVGQHFDKDPVAHPRVTNMRFDAGDLHDSPLAVLSV